MTALQYSEYYLVTTIYPGFSGVTKKGCVNGTTFFWRMVKKLCLGVDVAESEDEKFGVVYAVEFSPERLDFRID